jgi:hypothetical protein
MKVDTLRVAARQVQKVLHGFKTMPPARTNPIRLSTPDHDNMITEMDYIF